MRLAQTVSVTDSLYRNLNGRGFLFAMTKEHLLEITIVQPGRITAQYHPVTLETLRLEKIHQPPEPLPFDVGILPTALTVFGEPIAVLVLGSISHPLGTEMEARLLAAIQRAEEEPFLLVVPTADESAPQTLQAIPAAQRDEILAALQRAHPGEWRWLAIEEVQPYLHAAALRYRQRKAEDRLPQLDPAWQPLRVGRPEPSFAEAERYTAAEYTFFELPHRFQHYVSEFLAADERILYAARRPAMPSQRKRSWLRREGLQEGVLILTTQRLIQLSELIPPDSANIRYGFHAVVGVLERFENAALLPLGNNLLLRVEWAAAGGHLTTEWEIPPSGRASLEELLSLLMNFRSDPHACAIRRATTPPPPETLPPLIDPASDSPEADSPTCERFSTALTAALLPGEQPHAWALLPAWFDQKRGAQALAVTDRRFLLLPDHALDISLQQVAVLEFTSSILESSLTICHLRESRPQRETILFPYPAQRFFRECFEAARRRMAVLPLVGGPFSTTYNSA